MVQSFNDSFFSYDLKGSTKCRARVITRTLDGLDTVVHQSYEHNHPPRPEKN